MKTNRFTTFLFMLLALVSFSSCEAIADIFKAGVWTGLLLVVAVIAILIWIISRFRRK